MNTLIVLGIGVVIGMGTAFFVVAVTNANGNHDAELEETLRRSAEQAEQAWATAESFSNMYFNAAAELAAANLALSIEKKRKGRTGTGAKP